MALKKGKLGKMVIIALLLYLPIFFTPEFAWLAAQEEEAEELLKQGKQDCVEGQFEEAIEKLSLAINLLKEKDKLIDAYLHISYSHFALGEREKAKENLAELLKINPAQRLDPLFYPPDFVKLLDEAKVGILASIKVETEPPIAQVYLNEELVGVTPLHIAEVAAGEHKLKIIKQGYQIREESLILKVGEEKTVSIKLEKEEPKIVTTPPEPKPEVKKKNKTLLWVLLGGAAAAAVILLARGGGKEATPEPTPQPPMLTVRIKVTFEMANLEALWAIYIDDEKVFEEWLKVATHGGDNPVYGKRTRQFTIQRRPGSYDLKLHGVRYNSIYPEYVWVRSTKFELSIVAPASEINRYRINPDSFSLNVAPFKAFDPVKWPRQRTKRITISKIGTSTNVHSQQKHQAPLEAIAGKSPNQKN